METEVKPAGIGNAARSQHHSTSDAARAMEEAGHHISEKATQTHQVICDFTKENPTAALVMAFALGVVLSRFLSGR
ncbi:MAG: hypothetical protein JJU33_01160 [Phycisphaerales bacterium]|nr:hypothetical protein [Phycisphaerales bacterium]